MPHNPTTGLTPLPVPPHPLVAQSYPQQRGVTHGATSKPRRTGKDRKLNLKLVAGSLFCIALFALNATAQTNTFPATGNVGIGTTSPSQALEINNSNANLLLRVNPTGSPTQSARFLTGAFSGNPATAFYAYNVSGTNLLYIGGGTGSAEPASVIRFNTGTAGAIGAGTTAMTIIPPGYVGIGTTAPSTALQVQGNVTVSGTGNGIYFPGYATPQTVPYTGCTGADYAESVNVTGDRTKYEPGDILVIDPESPGKFLKSNQAYSTLVAGIYSTKPGFVGRLHPEDAESDKTEVPMAMVGRVPTKVSAENGPIKIGDLLVASSTLGYAMKGTDRNQMLGAVIGKALGPLDSGTGVIEVLVTLQ